MTGRGFGGPGGAGRHGTAAPVVGRLLELRVGPVAHGGHCVARHSGRVVFVRHALPGERVVARVTEGRAESRYWRADAVEVAEPSPDRVEPPCPYAGPGLCGGCDWQHATPAAQRRLKAAVLAEQLSRLAGVDVPVDVEELPGSPGGLGWRTRVSFSVDASGRAGFRRHRSHEVQPVESCSIAHPLVEGVGVEGQPWPGYSAVEVVAATGTGERLCVVEPAGDEEAAGDEEEAALSGLPPDVSVVRRAGRGHQVVRGSGAVAQVAAGRRFTVSAAGFWQVHPAAADTLTEAVVTALKPRPGDTVLDLYSGVGLFAAALAPLVAPTGRVVAVEGDPVAVADARRNLADGRTRVVRGRADRLLPVRGRPRHPALRKADLVVLDPPRSGAGARVAAGVVALRPRRVVYVACDPAALARDLATFTAQGYRVASLRAFDLFPMTHHVEAVALLRR